MNAIALSWNNAGMPRPKTGVTPKRNFRMPDAVWLPAVEKAEQEGRTMTAVISSALTRYAAAPAPDAPEHDPWTVVRAVMRELSIEVSSNINLDEAVEIASDLLRALGVKPVQGDDK